MAQRRVGTSGWSYQHWRDNFYPENVAKGYASQNARALRDIFATQ